MMARNKTYLSQYDQCQRTIELAQEWSSGLIPFIRMLPEERDERAWKKADVCIKKEMEARECIKYRKSYEKFLGFFWGDESFEIGSTWAAGIAKYNSKFFIKDDLVLILLSNGTDRQPVWSVSTKGKCVTGYYFDTSRSGFKGEVEYIGFPGELAGKQLTHPDALAFMQNLRAGKGPQSGRHV